MENNSAEILSSLKPTYCLQIDTHLGLNQTQAELAQMSAQAITHSYEHVLVQTQNTLTQNSKTKNGS